MIWTLRGNASTLIARSAGVSELNTSIFDGFQKGNLKDCIVNVADNLHVIPAQVSFKNLPKFLYSKFENEIDQVSYLNQLLNPIRSESLQAIADEYLNTDVEHSITIIRLKDFILALKELGYKRKECQLIWLVANFDPARKEQSREWAKKAFNKELWPLD